MHQLRGRKLNDFGTRNSGVHILFRFRNIRGHCKKSVPENHLVGGLVFSKTRGRTVIAVHQGYLFQNESATALRDFRPVYSYACLRLKSLPQQKHGKYGHRL